MNDYNSLITYLKSLSDSKYLAFNQKLIKTKYLMLGIKIPILRKTASKYNDLNILDYPNEYYEVVMLKGFIIAKLPLNNLIKYFHNYIYLLDNWALVDTFASSLKIIKDNKETFIPLIDKLLNSKEEYIVRLGFVLLLNYYVEDKYLEYIYNKLITIKSDLYYINMAKAWLVCECFIYDKNKTLKLLKNNKLDKFTHNKALSKIKDSYQIDTNTKRLLSNLKQ